MTPLRLTATVGLPGSGKSDWTRRQVEAAPAGEIARLNRDSLRQMLHFGHYAGASTETVVTAIERLAVSAAFQAGVRWVIVDDTNLRPELLCGWYGLAQPWRAAFSVRSFLDVPLQTCIDRDAARTGATHVGADNIRAMHDAYYEQALYCVNLAREGLAPFEGAQPA